MNALFGDGTLRGENDRAEQEADQALTVTPTEKMMQITKVPAGTVIRQRAGISYVAYSIEVNATGYRPIIVRDTDGHAHYFRPETEVIVPVATEPLT